MTANEKEDITRRIFFKSVTRTVICCACLPWDAAADSAGSPRPDSEEGNEAKRTEAGKEHLAAACGTWCGACPAYLARQGKEEELKLRKQSSSTPVPAAKGIPDSRWMDGLVCDGCLSGGLLAPHCRNCAIRVCAAKTQQNSRCSGCEELPCHRINSLIHMGQYLHRKEYLPNLKKMREMGVPEWVKQEEARWRCPQCGLPMSWYDARCIRCGAARSRAVFPLS